MISASLTHQQAGTLLRIRWLTWGAIAAMLASHLTLAIAQPFQTEILLLEQTAAHASGACGCTHSAETI